MMLLTKPHLLHVASSAGAGRGWQGGVGVGIVHNSCEPRPRLATRPRCIDEQSDSVLGFENIIHLKCN